MTESNTKKIDEAESKNVKLTTTLDSHTIFAEYYFEDLLFPNDVLEKWKIKLEIMRSRADNKFETKQPPVRRPVNDERLHEVFKNIMNEDSFLVAEKKINFVNIMSVDEHQEQITSENSSKSISADQMSNDSQKSKDESLKVEKTKQKNHVNEANVNSNISNAAKNHIASTATKTRSKKL